MNTVEVVAKASDGTVARRRVKVKFMKDGKIEGLDGRLLAQRNRLMENRLLDLKRRSLEIQTEQAEAVRGDLLKEIERERQAARELAEKQRKELELEVED